MNLRAIAAFTLCLAAPALAQPANPPTQPAAGMLRYPAISGEHIAFVYANQIWLAPRTGGAATPVASPPGPSGFPQFSPDGKTIAFVGNYDGNRDIYTVSIMGGIPQRITHHPGNETLVDWTSDNRLLFLTNGFAGLARQSQLFTVPADGGLPQRLPMPYAGFGSISADGKWVVYTPHSTDNRTWKRYRGGMATDLWVLNLESGQSKQLTDWEGTDTLPMWGPGGGGGATTVYYLSDAGPEHRLNIWKADVASGQRSQVTNFKDDDVRWPGMGPGPGGRGEIVFQLGSALMVLDLATSQTRTVTITVPGARSTIRPRLEDASRTIHEASISPSGKRIVVAARGDLWSLPAKEGVMRNMTRSGGIFERDPVWSPDGKWIAYLSDESGEYELWVRPSDARAPEEKKDGDKDKEADEAAPVAPAIQPTRLTSLGAGFRNVLDWSPDSKMLILGDNSATIRIVKFTWNDAAAPTAELVTVDTDPWGNLPQTAWSGDSNWLAYTLTDEQANNPCIWLYNVKTGAKTRLTSPMFPSGTPAFDPKGDFLYFSTNRSFGSPIYGDLDTTWVYANTDTLAVLPLRKDVKSPFAPRDDAEELKKDDKKEDRKPSDKPAEPAKADDGFGGSWSGSATGGNLPAEMPFTMSVKVEPSGAVTATLTAAFGTATLTGTFDKASGAINLAGQVEDAAVSLTGTLKGNEASGTWNAGNSAGQWTARRRSSAPKADEPAKDDKAKADPKKPKEQKFDLEDIEARAISLPVPPGVFGNLACAEDGKLLYVRAGARGAGEGPSIRIFDVKDEAREEKTVIAGAGSFAMSGNGKKILVRRGTSFTVYDAASGGGKAQAVSTSGMRTMVEPREEWRQIVTDAWRLQRDFFYEPTLHGVNWDKVRDHYARMIEDAASREDVGFILGEMVSELNIGHAYITSLGDVETGPSLAVGLLGADYELEQTPQGGVYKFSAIYRGAPWDLDARAPLDTPGEKKPVKVGDYLLAVNGVPVNPFKDPWASFIGLADRATVITVSEKPSIDASAREILVRPVASEVTLRYRAWIEKNRKYVEEKTGGRVGYIYVPNTGVDGQNDLYRQYVGQRGRDALIIDERWNGGGQIPTRFIELLNRPVTNYWARRHGKDWTWPPDSAQGPKCMLVNGLAGSGGDMFPWLFKHNQLGKVIGTRTWGGLVGISGNPPLIDGGAITVPTFGFYKKDGNWGVEGHGVDPDIVVVDDPALMLKGGDPQLDAAIAHMLEELNVRPYKAPARPKSPDRSGMGIPQEQR